MLIRLIRWVRCFLVGAVWSMGLASGVASAQSVAPSSVDSDVYAAAKSWLDQSLSQQRGDLPLRMEVEVGQLDRRLTLAPCRHVQPYLPPNVRLWGRARLGLRCVQGAVNWNVFLPITIKAWGPAWVIKSQVTPGATLDVADAMSKEVDWAESVSPIVANQADWVGKTATRLLSAGQPLRQEMVKDAQVFQSGAQVRVIAAGIGFEIISRAQALTAGFVGQSAKVKMDNGQVVSGTVSDPQTVRLML
jgi:flagellar basal body P-ring formation protein FlgA